MGRIVTLKVAVVVRQTCVLSGSPAALLAGFHALTSVVDVPTCFLRAVTRLRHNLISRRYRNQRGRVLIGLDEVYIIKEKLLDSVEHTKIIE